VKVRSKRIANANPEPKEKPKTRRIARLRLHCVLVNYGTLFQLSGAQSAFGDKVEVSGLTLGTALTRRDAAGIKAARRPTGIPIRQNIGSCSGSPSNWQRDWR
jgi:hypothetical protein